MAIPWKKLQNPDSIGEVPWALRQVKLEKPPEAS